MYPMCNLSGQLNYETKKGSQYDWRPDERSHRIEN